MLASQLAEREKRMKTSTTGLQMIESFEGVRLSAYFDVAKVPTIGYGHTGSVNGTPVCAGMTITIAQAEQLLAEDLAEAEAKVNKYSKYNFNQNQFDALVSFAYNIGNIDKLTANGRRSIATIASKFPEYNHAGGKVVNGLTQRRRKEQLLFNTPCATTSTSCKKSYSEIAREVIAGKWGNGATRKIKIQAAGYNYAQVQAAVNVLLR